MEHGLNGYDGLKQIQNQTNAFTPKL
jgi:hypothetical protein